MTSQTTYTDAASDFSKVYDQALATRDAIVITREGSESVSVLPTAELNSLMETAYLFQSPENAARLLAAIERANAQTFEPRSVSSLRHEYGLDEAT